MISFYKIKKLHIQYHFLKYKITLVDGQQSIGQFERRKGNMVVEKIVPKDKETQEKKYLLFLVFVLNKLKNGRKSGISLRNIADDYKVEMGTTLDRQEQKEFIGLYEDKYFERAVNSLERMKINQKGKEYLGQKENQSSLVNLEIITDKNKPQAIPNRKMTKGEKLGIAIGIFAIIITIIIAYIQGAFDKYIE